MTPYRTVRFASLPPDHVFGSDLPESILPRPISPWPEKNYKLLAHACTGAWIGAIAGCISLLLNIVGSVAWPTISGHEQHALRLIQVYLTFPLGEAAMELSSGFVLALGCILYVVTGMLYGAVFETVLSYWLPRATWRARVIGCTILALAVWVFNFYAVLNWLQPLLLGGRWIIDLVPWWVAALTHLAFGWTVALLNLGRPSTPAANEERAPAHPPHTECALPHTLFGNL
jgi:hypothetical protein